MRGVRTYVVAGIVCLWVFFLTSVASAIPTTRLELLDTLITPGETFDVEVRVDGVTDVDASLGPDYVLAFGFNVQGGSFIYNGATVWPGQDLTTCGDPLAPTQFCDDSLLFGLDAAGSTLPDPSSFGDDEIYGDNILLATLNFTAPSTPGLYSLGIVSDLSDPNQGLTTLLYYYDPLNNNSAVDMTTSIDVQVSGVSVPEPGTFLLFAIGVTGIGIIGRYRLDWGE